MVWYPSLNTDQVPNSSGRSDFLKLLAALCMLLDHTAFVFFDTISPELYAILHSVGRIAFPVFAGLIVLGFRCTRNLKAYFLRLILFALLSQIPAALAFRWPFWKPNILFTLAFGLIMLSVLSRIRPAWPAWLASAAFCILAQLLKLDYGWYGAAVIAVLYLLRNQPAAALTVECALSAVLCFMQDSLYPIWACAGFLLILFTGFSQARYPQLRLNRWFFYWFYPVHLLVLVIARELILG